MIFKLTVKSLPISQVAVHLGATTVSFSPPPPAFPLLACQTVRSVARPVPIRQKTAIHSPTLISGMQRRASLPNIRKKSNVSSLSLVSLPLSPYDHMSALSHKSLAERRAQEQLTPVYQQRREALKSIPKFWPVALLKHSLFALQAQHDADRLALSYLEDVWVVRDPREPKVFTLEFVRPV
jgi:hypothetical protein